MCGRCNEVVCNLLLKKNLCTPRPYNIHACLRACDVTNLTNGRRNDRIEQVPWPFSPLDHVRFRRFNTGTGLRSRSMKSSETRRDYLGLGAYARLFRLGEEGEANHRFVLPIRTTSTAGSSLEIQIEFHEFTEWKHEMHGETTRTSILEEQILEREINSSTMNPSGD